MKDSELFYKEQTMHFNTILTKEFLTEQLLNQRKKVSVVGEENGCSKHTVLRYAKIHNIYDELLKIRSFVNGKVKDLASQTFGSLIVLERVNNDRFGKSRWNCKCSCGRTKVIHTSSLTRGLTKTCGYCERVNFKGYKTISGAYFRTIKEGANARELEFNITIEDIYNIWTTQNGKCALSGVNIFFATNQDKALQTASVDRIDNQKGYTIDNIQIIHKRLNRIKSVLDNEELIFWAHNIVSTHKESVELDVSKLKWNNGERK